MPSSRSTSKGKFLALRIRHLASMGAYIGAVGANIQTLNFARCLPGMYDIKLIDIAARCVFTNTAPTAPYRGAGRPEANYIARARDRRGRARHRHRPRRSCAGAT